MNWKMKDDHVAFASTGDGACDWGQDDWVRIRIRWSDKLGLELNHTWTIPVQGIGQDDVHEQKWAEVNRVVDAINTKRLIDVDLWKKEFHPSWRYNGKALHESWADTN